MADEMNETDRFKWEAERAAFYARHLADEVETLANAGAGYDNPLEAVQAVAETAMRALLEIETGRRIASHADPAWLALAEKIQDRAEAANDDEDEDED